MTDDVNGYAPVAVVERNGFDEGLHLGRVVGLAADGSVAFAVGDVEAPIHPRSANKLLQSAGMRACGLELEGAHLALSAASHWGQSIHLDGVRAVLAAVGLDELALATTPALPEDAEARAEVVRAGGTPRPIYHGCSGKHAAMLATCVVNGWPTDGYLDVDHPLQLELRQQLERMIGAPPAHTAVDGCGAPAWAMPLTSLASAYRGAVLQEPGTALRDVADAMRAHPVYVCGEQSEVTGLMRAVPGLLLKDGAEAVYAAALPDGRAVAVKVADGGFRAAQAVLVAALRRLGVDTIDGVDIAAIDRWGEVPVLGHGHPVGRVRPLVP